MGRVAYVCGRYVPHAAACVHVEDRGYQFSDGIYEVIGVTAGRLVDEDLHLDRLDRSLAALAISAPMSRAAMRVVLREMLRRNRIHHQGMVYLQVTRGVAPRNHAFPSGVSPVLVMTARTLPPFDFPAARRGVSVITLADERWRRPDIKSVSLLPNVLAKQRAVEAGAFEAWLVDAGGMITEGTASNAWIVSAQGELITRPADRSILVGITRTALLDLARRQGLDFVERPFGVDEAKSAKEAFITSTTSWIKPVVRIDGVPVGDGRAGRLSLRLLDLYAAHAGEDGAGAE